MLTTFRTLNDSPLFASQLKQRMTARSNPNAVAYRDRLITWILRIYNGAGGFPRFAQTGNSNQSQIADLLGLEALGHTSTTEAQAVGMLRQAWRQHLEQHGDSLASIQPCHPQRCLQWIVDCAQLIPQQMLSSDAGDLTRWVWGDPTEEPSP